MSAGLYLPHGKPDQVAIIEPASDTTVTYADLDRLTQQPPTQWPREKSLVFLFADSSLDCVLTYLTALRHGHVVALLDRDLNEDFAQQLLDLYRPAVVWGREFGSLPTAGNGIPVNPDLTILLSTSGSTGSPKFVRLSRDNIVSNTEAIIDSLHLSPQDRAITTLPLNYSYGMSVLNTHLWAGGSIVLTDASAVQPEFWTILADYDVTGLSGVPFSYQMMLRTGLARHQLPALRTLTQAGGAMNPKLAKSLLDLVADRGWQLYVMYGQTEAAPRIACIPSDRLPDKLGSAGQVLAGGVLEVVTDEGVSTAPDVVGEIRYRGPNVMLGYAETAADLARGDDQHGELLTGDIGYLDSDGFLWITGRSKRFAKVFGLRINLDEVEKLVSLSPTAAVEYNDKIHVFHLTQATDPDRARSELISELKIAAAGVQFHPIEEIPTLGTGKPDYARLRTRLEG